MHNSFAAKLSYDTELHGLKVTSELIPAMLGQPLSRNSPKCFANSSGAKAGTRRFRQGRQRSAAEPRLDVNGSLSSGKKVHQLRSVPHNFVRHASFMCWGL